MPEGHTIHRLARDHRRWFAGGAVSAESPQGRFSEGADRLSGRELARVEAWGKHLFYHFEEGPILHVHLGLFGRFRMRKRPAIPARSPPRLVLFNDQREVRLSGPTACELLDPTQLAAILGRLGPDPLRDPSECDAFVASASRRRKAVGAVLLDQSIIAGIGNVYRSELLFLEGIHPAMPAREVPLDRHRALWHHAARLLAVGVTLNRIVTVDPSEVGKAKLRELRRGERQYVYRRRTCLRCGTAIERTEIGQRTAYACPSCQPRKAAP